MLNLESEGIMAAEVNVAEGRKQARILASEAEKQEWSLGWGLVNIFFIHSRFFINPIWHGGAFSAPPLRENVHKSILK